MDFLGIWIGYKRRHIFIESSSKEWNFKFIKIYKFLSFDLNFIKFYVYINDSNDDIIE